MESEEIQAAVVTLGFLSERFRRLAPEEAKNIYFTALRHFVPKPDINPAWWWEYFSSSTGIHFPSGDGSNYLTKFVPDPDERVWFIADDHSSPHYSVWEGSVRDIQAIIGECYSFEYYLVQQQLHWILCENHHDILIAMGELVETGMREYLANRFRKGGDAS